MKTHKRARALAAAALCLCAATAVAENSVWYVGGSLPLTFVDDTHTETGATVQTPNGPLSYTAATTTTHETGFKLDGVLGYEFGSGFRAEGEAFFAQSGVEKLTYTGITVPALNFTLPGKTVVPVSGNVRQMGLMANLWYDFNAGSKWRPYVGGGLGIIRIDQSDLEYDEAALTQEVSDAVNRALGQPTGPVPPEYVARVSDTDVALAYHLGAGIGYEWSDRVTVHLGYRRQATDELSFDGRNSHVTVESTTDLRIHFLEVGVRYRF